MATHNVSSFHRLRPHSHSGVGGRTVRVAHAMIHRPRRHLQPAMELPSWKCMGSMPRVGAWPNKQLNMQNVGLQDQQQTRRSSFGTGHTACRTLLHLLLLLIFIAPFNVSKHLILYYHKNLKASDTALHHYVFPSWPTAFNPHAVDPQDRSG